jgi:iron complex transport system substrate-binding protein
MTRFPSRIVCLTEETTETLYLLGEGDRVVGVSGYTVRPPEARQKPRVSAFISAKYERIESLQPDLILAFSDLQANITCELVKRGYPVMAFNQRSVDEILQMIRMLAALVGCADRGHALASRLELELDSIRAAATRLPMRPRVYFEEWDDPLISGIRWVDELIEIAGATRSFRTCETPSLAAIASSPPKRCARAGQTSSWPHGAARQYVARRSWPGRGGTRCRRSATGTSTRSSRPTSSSRVLRR